MGRADKAPLISYSPGVVASPPFPSAAAGLPFTGEGRPVPERKGTGGPGC